MAEEYKIEQCWPRKNEKTGEVENDFWRVYHWGPRPDADEHTDKDQECWLPESEHRTLEAAQARVAELEKGAKKKSLYGKKLPSQLQAEREGEVNDGV